MLISFLFLHENVCCGYSLEAPHWGTSNEYPQHMFSWRNKKNILWIPPLIYSYVIYMFWLLEETINFLDYLCLGHKWKKVIFWGIKILLWSHKIYNLDGMTKICLFLVGLVTASSSFRLKEIFFAQNNFLSPQDCILFPKDDILFPKNNILFPQEDMLFLIHQLVNPGHASEEANWSGSSLFVIKYVSLY